MAVTIIITTTSVLGIRLITKILCQAKVPMTTINITPTNAAKGICSIREDPITMNKSKNKDAVIPDILVRPPDFTLIID